jgi:hypothetical protein
MRFTSSIIRLPDYKLGLDYFYLYNNCDITFLTVFFLTQPVNLPLRVSSCQSCWNSCPIYFWWYQWIVKSSSTAHKSQVQFLPEELVLHFSQPFLVRYKKCKYIVTWIIHLYSNIQFQPSEVRKRSFKIAQLTYSLSTLSRSRVITSGIKQSKIRKYLSKVPCDVNS